MLLFKMISIFLTMLLVYVQGSDDTVTCQALKNTFNSQCGCGESSTDQCDLFTIGISEPLKQFIEAYPNESRNVVGATSVQTGKSLSLDMRLGSLPGYDYSYYPVIKSTHQNLYFSVSGAYSAYMTAGGTLNSVSSKAKKENYEVLDKQDVLSRLNKLNIERWNYISEDDDIKHIGPYAEDFHNQFGLGSDETMISSNDMAGVSMLAIQALTERLVTITEQQKASDTQQIDNNQIILQQKVATLESQNTNLLARLEALENYFPDLIK